jgi:hypothetical protein
MVKKSYGMLILAGLLIVALIGFLILYMSPCAVTIEKFEDVPKKTILPPAPTVSMAPNATPDAETVGLCGNLGIPATLQNGAVSVRAFSQVDCEAGIYGAKWVATTFDGQTANSPKLGMCMSADNSKNYSKLCSFPHAASGKPLVAATAAPVAPVAATPASSPMALKLTSEQCSALCPVTLESCEGKFSCQTKLEPIGNAKMVKTSTPAPV